MPATIPVNPARPSEPVRADRLAVAAVLQGDTLAYRELVERYQRLVYAVAWSRLGDAALAEDAAQEAFIRAYRLLPLLGNGAKFSSWITAIARNTAIKLGLQQRRELEKRARWAVEQPKFEAPAATAVESCSPEILRQALAELPDEYRESLVLFYLEGKRGAAAAAALGLAEAALRMRLMRARAALRERLETRLGESLERLGPSHSFVPGVMSAIAASSTAKAGSGAAAGTTILAALGKVLPFKVATLLVAVAILFPYLGIDWLVGRFIVRSDVRKFRDPQGFRARLYRDYYGGAYLVSILAASFCFIVLQSVLGPQVMNAIFGIIALPILAGAALHLRVNHGKYYRCIFGAAVLLIGGLVAWGFALISTAWLVGILFVTVFLVLLLWDARPLRMDYNLFLRERLGLLSISPDGTATVPAGASLARSEQWAFARFLGTRFLVGGFLWPRRGEGLRLWLRAAQPLVRHFANPRLLPLYLGFSSSYILRKVSWVCLKGDGRVSVHCGEIDQASLRNLPGPVVLDGEAMEPQVAIVVEEAWRKFRAGQIAEAERVLGQLTEGEIFHLPPARFRRLRRLLLSLAALAAGGLLMAGLIYLNVFIERNYGTSAGAYWYRGHARLMAGDHAGAIADLTHSLERDPQDASAYNLRGVAKYDENDLAGAFADYTSAIKLDSKFSAALANRGIVRYKNDDYNGAIVDLTRALALNPRDDVAYFVRGQVRSIRGEYDAAIADFNRDLILDPKDGSGFACRGDAKRAQGDYAGANADYTRSLELNADNYHTFFSRGRVRQCLGDFAGALADFNQVIKLHPQADYSPLYRYLLQLRLRQAPRDFAATVTAWPDSWRKTLGQFITGQLDESALLAAAQPRVGEQQAEADYCIGLRRLVNGDQAGARDFFQKSAALSAKTCDTAQFARAELAWLDATQPNP